MRNELHNTVHYILDLIPFLYYQHPPLKRWAIKNILKIEIAKCLEQTHLPYSLFLIPCL